MNTILHFRKLFIAMIIFLVLVSNCLAQEKIDDPNDLGLSENILALSNKPTSQFGQPAMGTSDLYTGIATYKIPFFELKSYNLKVPVSVSYASGGVRVGEIGGWLGISWQINAGGEISREMKGYPDEMPNKGYFVHGDNPPNGLSLLSRFPSSSLFKLD